MALGGQGIVVSMEARAVMSSRVLDFSVQLSTVGRTA